MKTLFIAENWPPRLGGMENYLTHLAGYLPANSVTVIAPLINGKEAVTALPGQGIAQVQRHRFFTPFIYPKWIPLFLKLKKQSSQEKYDVILCGKALFEGLIGYYLKKKLNIPYVIFTYAMEIQTWRAAPRQRHKLKKVLAAADRVIYINDVTKTALIQLGVTEKQLVKIWPGVDDRYFNQTNNELIQSTLNFYQIKQPYILTVARLIPRKGINILIEAFSKLDQIGLGDVQLVIVGDGPAKDDLINTTNQYMVSARVKFLHQVPDKHLPALYHGTDVFALTPTETAEDMEGFGIVYTEAAACGTPAVATKTGGAMEAVIDHKTGLVVQVDNIIAIRDALNNLLTDNDLNKKLGQQARERAIDQFRWSKRALLTKAMLDSIIITNRTNQAPSSQE